MFEHTVNINQFKNNFAGAGWPSDLGREADLPAYYRAGWRVRFTSPPGSATLPTAGASVNVARTNRSEVLTG